MEKYEELTQKFILDMEAVGGSFDDFVEGLRDAEFTIRERRQIAESEQGE